MNGAAATVQTMIGIAASAAKTIQHCARKWPDLISRSAETRAHPWQAWQTITTAEMKLWWIGRCVPMSERRTRPVSPTRIFRVLVTDESKRLRSLFRLMVWAGSIRNEPLSGIRKWGGNAPAKFAFDDEFHGKERIERNKWTNEFSIYPTTAAGAVELRSNVVRAIYFSIFHTSCGFAIFRFHLRNHFQPNRMRCL